MDRLLDSQNFDGENQEIIDNTPLRGDFPRLRRTELPSGTKSILPRKWPLSFTLQEFDEDREQHNADKSENPGCINIKTLPLKQIYSGDRFIPSRRGHSFEVAHHLLMKSDTTENKQTLDVCAQISSLEDTYRRKAMRAMLQQVLFPELNQGKILSFSGSMVRPRDPPRSECEEGSWKCTPRKKILIKSVDKMLSIPDGSPLALDVYQVEKVDWSCNDMIAASNSHYLCIYDTNGEEVSSYEIRTTFTSGGFLINDIKWSNDGTKLIMTALPTEENSSSRLLMYELKNKKILWNVVHEYCSCDAEDCFIECICWSPHNRQIVIGCDDRISIFESNTGKLLHSIQDRKFNFETLSFSPNSKYLISIGNDKYVRGFAWPELTPCFDKKFPKPVKALAWHPQESGLLCIGDADGWLSLWNVNKTKLKKKAVVRVKFNGCVKNLAWNKLSGELVVHWIYEVGNNSYTIVAVLASFNQIVDVVPINKESRPFFFKFNASHEKLITFCCDNVCSIWNFFGNEKSSQKEERYKCSGQPRQGLMIDMIR